MNGGDNSGTIMMGLTIPLWAAESQRPRLEGAKAAVSGMIDLLSTRYKMNPVDAYMLCSVCGDLRISEIVDMPNWVVSFYFPRLVFE